MNDFYDSWNKDWKEYVKKNRIKWTVSKSREFCDILLNLTFSEIFSFPDREIIITEVNNKKIEIKRLLSDGLLGNTSWFIDDPSIVANLDLRKSLNQIFDDFEIEKMVEQVKNRKEEQTTSIKKVLGCKMSDIKTFQKNKMYINGKKYTFLEKEEVKKTIFDSVIYFVDPFLTAGISVSLLRNEFLVKSLIDLILEKKETMVDLDWELSNLRKFLIERVEKFQKKFLIGKDHNFFIYDFEK